MHSLLAWRVGVAVVKFACGDKVAVLLPKLKEKQFSQVHRMRFSHIICKLVGIFVTFYMGLTVTAEETEDLARGTLGAWFFLAIVSSAPLFVYFGVFYIVLYAMYLAPIILAVDPRSTRTGNENC